MWKMPDLMRLTDPKDRHNARWLVVSVGGALVVAVGLLYTARSYQLTHRGQVTDRFIKALERLGSDELYVRYGGILALEQIVQDAPDQATHAAQVLGAFIRTRAPQSRVDPVEAASLGRMTSRRLISLWRVFSPGQAHHIGSGLPDKPPEDLQAALAALARPASRRHVPSDHPVVLEGLHLAGARLRGVDLTRADLRNANLTRTDLAEADLTGANLSGADLTGVNLIRANLTGADLYGAIFRDASLDGANLSDMLLVARDLNGAIWSADTRWPDMINGMQVQDKGAQWMRSLSEQFGDSGRHYRVEIRDDDPLHFWAR